MSPCNITASVRQEFLNLLRDRGEDFGLMLTRYAIESLMYVPTELEQNHDQFVIKGVMLFAI